MYQRYRQTQDGPITAMDKKMYGSYRAHLDEYYDVDQDMARQRKKTKRQNTKRGGKGKSKKTMKRGRKYKK